MIDNRIQSLIAGCIEQMRKDGYAEQCIETHRRRWQKGIISFMIEKQTVAFTSGVGEAFLHERGYTRTNPGYVLSRNNFPQHEKLPSVYDSDEIRKVEDSIEQSSAVGKRDYAIFVMASRLGLRVSDIASLTWNNVDWDNGKITLYQSKTKNPVELPLLKDIGEVLVVYARDARPKSLHKEVFLSAKAPYRPMNRLSLNGVITRIMQSSGVEIKTTERQILIQNGILFLFYRGFTIIL